jgi:soluble lytic murein transglycosylase
MIKKIFVSFPILIAFLAAMLKWGDLSGAVRVLESLVKPVVHKEIINRACGLYKEDPLFIMSIIKVESNFLKGAKSSRGAMGLMQLMPATAREIAHELRMRGFKESDLENPETNIMFGVYYVGKLRKEFGDDDMTVLAAYNAGRKNVQDWLKTSRTRTIEIKNIEFIETQNFVGDVLSGYAWLKRLQQWKGRITKKESADRS